MINHLSDMNVKLQHMELKYDKKLKEMETHHARSMKQMETKYKMKFTEYENKLQEYENRLQTIGGDDNKKRKRDPFDEANQSHFAVTGCGVDEVNGAYSREGEYDGVPKYVRTAQYRGRREVFSLYRFAGVWYISIIRGSEPSNDGDTDFYVEAETVNNPLPPTDNWECKDRNGVDPPPKVYPVSL